MKINGKDAWQFGDYEFQRVMEWLPPIALTAGLNEIMGWISALSAAGGWRSLLSIALVVAGRALWQLKSDNSNRKT